MIYLVHVQALLAVGIDVVIGAKMVLAFKQIIYVLGREFTWCISFARAAAFNGSSPLFGIVLTPTPRLLIYLCTVLVAIASFGFAFTRLAKTCYAVAIGALFIEIPEWLDHIADGASAFLDSTKTNTFGSSRISSFLAATLANGIMTISVIGVFMEFSQWFEATASRTGFHFTSASESAFNGASGVRMVPAIRDVSLALCNYT